MIGKDKVPFVGYEIDSSGINMSQKRSVGTIAFVEPRAQSVCAKLRFVFYGFNNCEPDPKNQLLRFQNYITIQIVI